MTADRETYDPASHYWLDGGRFNDVLIQDITGSRLLTIPLAFLRESGDDTWQFVHMAIRACIVQDGLLRHQTGLTVQATEPVVAGIYVYLRTSPHEDKPCDFTRGPESKTRFRPPSVDFDASTVSNSSRSTPRQNRFHFLVGIRDGECLVTADPAEDCVAAHILDLSRPDLYKQVLGVDYSPFLYYPWMGLTLAPVLHKAHDNGEWAFFPRDDGMVVHYFTPSRRVQKSYHGKVVPWSFFRGGEEKWPNRQLLLFHHAQCMQMHFRAFSHGMSVQDAWKAIDAINAGDQLAAEST